MKDTKKFYKKDKILNNLEEMSKFFEKNIEYKKMCQALMEKYAKDEMNNFNRLDYESYNRLLKIYNDRKAIEEFLYNYNSGFILTITTTFGDKPNLCKNAANFLLKNINIKLFRKEYKRTKAPRFLKGVVIIEKGRYGDNTHYHILLQNNEKSGENGENLERLIEKVIKLTNRYFEKNTLNESGIRLSKIYDKKGICNYLTKEYKDDNSNIAFLSFRGIDMAV